MRNKYSSLIVAVVAVHLLGSAIAQERHEGQMHHSFPKDVDGFHSVLAPLWHAPSGQERSRNACAKAGEMERLADNIRSGDAAPLLASVVALQKACRSQAADIDAALSDVHEAFHRLADAGNPR